MVANTQRGLARSRTSKMLLFAGLGWFLFVVGGTVAPDTALGQSAYEIAQIKSQRMAQMGIRRLGMARPSPHSIASGGMRHVMPFWLPRNAYKEGVGFSEHSPGQAIRNACHFGRRPMITSAVARGQDGYYATVYYR